MKTEPQCTHVCDGIKSSAGPRPIDRRMILRAGAAGSVLAATLPLACGQGASVTAGPIDAGNVSLVTAGTLTILRGSNLVLGRDANGLYAMSAVCTHAGCIVGNSPTGKGVYCGCHGSAFDSNGAVTKGPAGSPLQHYQVDLASDGTITIQGSMPISSTARTAVA